ncbi:MULTISPECIES: hypothetical protein [unclassified Iodidimonas]|jgi:flagellar motility protein MotE (MotC chaperone)|uniref:MotE family protein n=1 Tax=unclassified Iodidimonas TaxID=2626145 RepID=UPI0024823C15|nr:MULTISPECIES: hypothetical protein [unclassified Iodidimonas]
MAVFSFRIMPISIAVLSMAAMAQAYQLAPDNDEAAKTTAAAQPQTDDETTKPYNAFGQHDRPWARNLLPKNAQSPLSSPEPLAKSVRDNRAPTPQNDDNISELTELFYMTDAFTSARAERVPSRALALIREREADLARQEADLADARALVEASRRAVAADFQKLQDLHQKTSQLLDRLQQTEEADLTRMTNLYQNMKPKEAAEILNEMDERVVAAVIERMPERIGAPILARMDVQKARLVMRLFADRKAAFASNNG